jgi:predicted ABC-type ATPase
VRACSHHHRGPNGSGKSTLTASLAIEGRDRLLDPDAIARRLNLSDPSAAAIPAGREVLRRIEEYLGSQVSFAVETTLASRRSVDLIHRAKSCGFEVHLVFVGLNSPDKSIVRIRNRVSRGGHAVPDTDVRRRYARSLANAADALRSVDYARVYDNSGDGHQLILIARSGKVAWQMEPLPEWARFAIAASC